MANEWISSNLGELEKNFNGVELKWLTDLYVDIVAKLRRVFPDEASEVAIRFQFEDAKAFVEASNKLYHQWETLKDSDEAKRMKSSFERDMNEFKRKFEEYCSKKMEKVDLFLNIFKEFDSETKRKNIAMGVVRLDNGRLDICRVDHFVREIEDFIEKNATIDEQLLDWFDSVKFNFNLMDKYSNEMYENLLLFDPKFNKLPSTIKEFRIRVEKLKKAYGEILEIYENRKRILKWFFTPTYHIDTINYSKVQNKFSELGKYFENLSFDEAFESVIKRLKNDTSDVDAYLSKMFSSAAIVDVLEVFDKEDLVKDFCMGIENSKDGIKNILKGKKITPFKFLKKFSVSKEYSPIDPEIEDWIQKKIPEFVKKLNTESESMCKNINDIEKKNYCSKEQYLKKYKSYVFEVLSELNKSLKERKKIIEDLFDIKSDAIFIEEAKDKFIKFIDTVDGAFSKNFNDINSTIKGLK